MPRNLFIVILSGFMITNINAPTGGFSNTILRKLKILFGVIFLFYKFIHNLAPQFENSETMAGTSIKRKERKNKTKSRIRQQNIKLVTAKPTIKNVDIEKIKAEFEQGAKKPKAAGKAKSTEKKEAE